MGRAAVIAAVSMLAALVLLLWVRIAADDELHQRLAVCDARSDLIEKMCAHRARPPAVCTDPLPPNCRWYRAFASIPMPHLPVVQSCAR